MSMQTKEHIRRLILVSKLSHRRTMEWHKTAPRRFWCVSAVLAGTYERLTWELNNGAWHVFGADGYAKSGLVLPRLWADIST